MLKPLTLSELKTQTHPPDRLAQITREIARLKRQADYLESLRLQKLQAARKDNDHENYSLDR